MVDKIKSMFSIKNLILLFFIILITYIVINIFLPPSGLNIPKLKIVNSIVEPVESEDFSLNQCENTLIGEEKQRYLSRLKEIKKINKLDMCLSIINDSIKDCPLEIYPISDMNKPRVFPETIKLKNGDVLIIGGDRKDKESVELFNFKNNNFELITNDIKSYLPQGYQCYKFCKPIILPNNNVYYKGAIYNFKKKKFEKIKSNLVKTLVNYDNIIKEKKVIKIFSDGKVLLSLNSNKILLEDPIYNKQYKPGEIFHLGYDIVPMFIDKNQLLLSKTLDNTHLGGLVNGNVYIYNPILGNVNLVNNSLAIKPIQSYFRSIIPVNSARFFPKDFFAEYSSFNNINFPILLTNNRVLINTYFQDFEYTSSVVLNFKNNKIKKEVLLPANNQSVGFVKDKYALFVNSGVAYLIDLNGSKRYRIINGNLSLLGQSFTVLNNGNVLIVGGKLSKENNSSLNIIFEKSKYASLLDLKR